MRHSTLYTYVGAILAGALGTGCMSSTSSPEGSEVAVSTDVDAEGATEDCPSALPGASTEIVATDDGAALVITSDDSMIAENIRALAHLHAEMRPVDASDIEYTTWGSGGAECPIVHEDTTVTVEDIAGGARVHVEAEDDDSAPRLRATIRQRVDALPPRET